MASDAKGKQAQPVRGLLIFDNPDKKKTRPLGPDPAMPNACSRILLCGPPGCGKRNLCLNIIFKFDPPPTSIHIVHHEPETKEYKPLDDIGCPIYYYSPEDFPTPKNLESPDPPPIGDTVDDDEDSDEEEKDPIDLPEVESAPLVIIDEVTRDTLGIEGCSRFERLMNYGATHKNSTVFVMAQDITSIPPKARRGVNQFCLWKQPDKAAETMAATRAGVPPEMLQKFFQELCHDKRDSIWIDCDVSPDSPWRFRLNFLYPIQPTEAVQTGDYA